MRTKCWICGLLVLPAGCLSQRIEDYIDGLQLESSEGTTGGSSSGSSGSSSAGDSSSGDSTETGGVEGSAGGESSTTATTTTSTTATAESGESGSTTLPNPATCGDGSVAGEEECDDGNLVPDDGCSADCAADIRVFVTGETYKAGELMSPALADARCIQRAYDGELEGAVRFRAWLSTTTQDARDRFDTTRRGRIVLINGLVVAAGWPELLAGALDNPIEVTHLSETYHGRVWTGTKVDGTAADSQHCLDWTSNSLNQSAYYGYSDEISSEWSLADQMDNPSPCISPHAIYCFDSL